MIFQGIDNQQLELRFLSYPAEELTKEEQTYSWLRVFVEVKSKLGNWQTVDPCLTVLEVYQLATWLSDLASSDPDTDTHCGFTEPNLSFTLENEITDPQKLIRIHFWAELKPKSAKKGEKYFLDMEADEQELKRLASELKSAMAV